MQLPIEPHLTARAHFKGLGEKNRVGAGGDDLHAFELGKERVVGCGPGGETRGE